ncbi:alpha-galactosidase A-like [Sarcoptes scabiei]|nr:alpha-galactosidase A-like [Sarcoptes scabiei]
MFQIVSIRLSVKLLKNSPSSSRNYECFSTSSIVFDEDCNDIVKRYRLTIPILRYEKFIFFHHHLIHSRLYRKLVKENIENLILKEKKLKKCRLKSLNIELCHPNDLGTFDIVVPINVEWNNRIVYLAHLKMDLEETLSWLSTLGGAYSSLGDHNLRFAKLAETITFSQLRLSSIYDDPNLRARCLIYLSHSWCQQGKRREAIKLIKYYLYPFLVHLGPRSDVIVRRMYQALCFRIKYIYKYFNINLERERSLKSS